MNMHLIESHIENINFDVRITRDARFIDQKVTPDVLCIISDCVLQFVGNDKDKIFTTKDIWESDFANENVIEIFGKPNVTNKRASSEYDKFFAQPLKMLAYSKILTLEKKGTRNFFKVSNIELLKYVSIKERNALNFINLYLIKVLKDSELWSLFNSFFMNNNKDNFQKLKIGFTQFLWDYTAISEGKHLEPRRIFPKVLNPLAYTQRTHGTYKGNFSKDIIGYDELMYNRKNWRDNSKQKGETRQECELRLYKLRDRELAFVKFTMGKAKRLIRERYNQISEIQSDGLSAGQATQVHHIFPQADYPLIKSYLENLILLTATQHSTKAHPNNNTRLIDKDYQLLCLLAKSSTIKKSIEELNDGFYSKEDFVFVLNEGISPDKEFEVNLPFNEIERDLAYAYQQS